MYVDVLPLRKINLNRSCMIVKVVQKVLSSCTIVFIVFENWGSAISIFLPISSSGYLACFFADSEFDPINQQYYF